MKNGFVKRNVLENVKAIMDAITRYAMLADCVYIDS